MKITIKLLPISCLAAFVTLLSQCAVYKAWFEGGDRVNLESRASAPRMPVVRPVKGRLLNETILELDGKRFLQQRIVILEFPLETELRVTEIP